MDLSQPYYCIQTREPHGWDAGTVNEPNRFPTEEEAQMAISSLRSLGEDYASAEYRIVRITPLDASTTAP